MVADPTRIGQAEPEVVRPGAHEHRGEGLKVSRVFTVAGQDPYDSIAWSQRTSRITNPDGSVVFEMTDAEIPAAWSQVATDIMVSKYFRKAGVPQIDARWQPDSGRVRQPGARSGALGQAGDPPPGRLLALVGREHGYFASEDDAQAFQDELAYMLVHQMAAPNSPQWFNTGLNYAYGITGPSQGHYYVDPYSGAGQPLGRRLHAPAAARLLHPVGRRRPGRRGRHHGPLGPRGAPLQVRLRHRHQLLAAPRRGREALRRRHVAPG